MEQLLAVTEPVGLRLASLCSLREVFRWWKLLIFLPLTFIFYVDPRVLSSCADTLSPSWLQVWGFVVVDQEITSFKNYVLNLVDVKL